MRRDVKFKVGNDFQQTIPRAPLRGCVAADAQQVLAHAGAEPCLEQRDQGAPDPGPQVRGIAISGIVVHWEAVLASVSDELRMRER